MLLYRNCTETAHKVLLTHYDLLSKLKSEQYEFYFMLLIFFYVNLINSSHGYDNTVY